MKNIGRNYKRGLSDEEVEQSRRKHGSNVLTEPEKEPLWRQFLEKFEDPIIRILLIALCLSLIVSGYQLLSGEASWTVLLEPLGIFMAVMLATCVGFVFELSANRKFDILNLAKDERKVTVIRNALIGRIERKNVVVGDTVVIETGDEIPADGTLVEAISLQVNESDLTGEQAARKTVDPAEFKKDATYPSNYVCRGSTVIEGHGVFVVEKVGDATELGKVYHGAQIDNKVKTPLNEQLDRLGDSITLASYVIAGLIVALRMVMYFVFGDQPEFDWMDFARFSLNTLMIAVTLIVVAVPEGLPMSVTLSLALSMKRMLETNNLVRKMHACETMGAATVICTDKTGTLTKNQMSVSKFMIFGLKDDKLDGSDLSQLVAEGIALNSTAFLDFTDGKNARTVGNPTEAALLLWLFENNVDYIGIRDNAEIVKQLPFSTKYKYMATIVKSDEAYYKLYVKGAPEIVMKHCNMVYVSDGVAPIGALRPTIEESLSGFQRQAMRTLGFAYKRIAADELDSVFDGENLSIDDMAFIGISAISDPVRDDVAGAVSDCVNAGIGIKIVTGDTSGTALEIGRQIGMWTSDDDEERNHVTGDNFQRMSDEELQDRVEDIKIMSRAKPMDKERLVRLLQQKGHVVAVTGDGTNDAPALNAAQIGLSMGDGTSVAKEASDITILDNSFKSIVRSVAWGRSLYRNIQRFILFQMTINVAACLIVLIGALLGTESPLTVTQMLWVNLIMDTFAALALASLPPERDVMDDKPRKRNSYIISKSMGIRIFGVGFLFVVVLFGLVQYFKHCDVVSLSQFSFEDFFANFFNFSHVNAGLSPYELSLFFTMFVFMQFWNIFNAKAFPADESVFHISGAFPKGFAVTLMIIFVGQILIVSFGGDMFNVVTLSFGDWWRTILSTSVIMWLGEFERMLRRWHRKA